MTNHIRKSRIWVTIKLVITVIVITNCGETSSNINSYINNVIVYIISVPILTGPNDI